MARLIAARVGQEEFDNTYSDVAQYGKISFWDDYYAKEMEPFEWYYGYLCYKEIITDYIPRHWKVMIAGCGNSNIIEDMVFDGYESVIGADISRVVISQLTVRCKDLPQASFFQGNMCDTDLPEESVDAIIDKCLFDSLLCSATTVVTTAQYLNEVVRLLSPGGVFIMITNGNPEERLPQLMQEDLDEPYYKPWNIDCQAISKPNDGNEEELDFNDPDNMYFIYICTKIPALVEKMTRKSERDNKKQSVMKTKHAPPL